VLYWSVLALCRKNGVDPTFRTAYMHPEKWHKAWFGSFSFKESYFRKVSGVVETCGCERSGLGSDGETQ